MDRHLQRLASILIVLLMGFTSCTSEKNPERSVGRAPASIVAVEEEASVILKDYGERISQIDVEKTSVNLGSNEERELFQKYMQHLEGSYDQAVIQMENYLQAKDLDKELRRQELEDALNKLEMSWDNFARNYRI